MARLTELRQTLRVLHLIRTYLNRTETFIYSQIQPTRSYDSWCIARNAKKGETELFPFARLSIYSQQAASWLPREWAHLNYRLLKRMTDHELRFYLRCIDGIRPNLIHIHYGTDAWYFLPLLTKVGIPSLVSFYGYDASSFPRRYFGLGSYYLRHMFRTVNRVLAMSEDMKDDLIRIGCPQDKIRIHYPNGVDLARFTCSKGLSPEQEGKVIILNVASMEGRKGQLDLVHAFAMVRERLPQVELHIAGEGPLRKDIEKAIRSLNLSRCVTLLGHVPYEELPVVLSRAHIFCHPSVTTRQGDKEGIPTIILEAAASCLPIVATLHAGIPEAVVDGQTGFLVKEHDIASLAKRLAELAEDSTMRIQMGHRGRAHIERHFDVRLLAEKREVIYDELLASCARSRTK